MRVTSLSLSLALIVCTSATSVAQDTESEPLSRTVLKLSPQHFVHNSLKAGIERFNHDHSSSFAVFVTGRLENGNNGSFYQEGYDGLAGELQFRKYVRPMNRQVSRKGNWYNQGIYAAGYIQGGSYGGRFRSEYSYYDPNTGQMVTDTQYDYTESIGNYGIGFTIGYQKTLWQVIFLEAFIGGGIQFADRTVSGQADPIFNHYAGITDPAYKGILPKIGLHIGIGL